MKYSHSILIGGIGDDAHSVGIRLLELGLRESGFHVLNIGIRNDIRTFFKYARDYDVIMISNKNGHAELYLKDFPELLNDFKLQNDTPRLWSIGGSLSVGESDFQVKKRYLEMGFSIVHPKPISFFQVVEEIRQELGRNEIAPKATTHQAGPKYNVTMNYDDIIDRKWDDDELDKQRTEILKEWPTGKEALALDLYTTGNGFQERSLDNLLWKNKTKKGFPLLQPRTGVADIEQQTTLLSFLEEQGSDVSSVQLDAACRSKMYKMAEVGVEMSRERKTSQLNGFPIPIYGVGKVKNMVNSLNHPFQLRGGGPDHRFTYEIALSAGIHALEGGFLCYCLPYDKLTNPVESMKNWQYIDRLCSRYRQRYKVNVNREYFGVLTATLIEPSIAIIINVIQAIMSAQQGVVSITVGYAEQGNRSQDIAAIKMLEQLTAFYLKKFGYHNCRVTTVFHQFMAAFPADYKRSEDLIFNSSITAARAGATKMMVKTPVEAINIPTRYDNADALKICKRGFDVSSEAYINYKMVAREKKLIEKEVHQIMNAIIEEGNGSVARGAVKAIASGIIDIPWSPSVFNANKVATVRDIDGAVRFYHFGNLPFDTEIKEFHQEKVHVRQYMERDSSIFSLLEKDLSRIWKNEYKQWPLDGTYVA
jgi:methylaspartate mutase epsilon subunit